MDDKKPQPVLIRVPATGNKMLEELVNIVNSHVELNTIWRVTNTNAIDRLKMTDHGPVHFQIVANIGLKIARMLVKQGIPMSIVKDFSLTNNHAELVVFLGCILHDLGISVSRDGHEEFSLFLANHIMHELLTFLPVDERTLVISETLHAIISHRKGGVPYTIEAGIVRVADALDMSKGRSRIPYESGKVDIHSISAAAIEGIEIAEGTNKPILIKVTMNNSAGVFQIDELLKSKLKGSGLEKYMEIFAFIDGEEKKLLTSFTF